MQTSFRRTAPPSPPRRPSARHQRMAAEFAERGVTQWALMEALAFAERAGIVICAVLFLLNDTRDFWTFWGLGFVLANVMFLAPVYGILIFLCERLAYRARKWIKKPIISMDDLKGLGRAVHVFWLPLMALSTGYCFDLYNRLTPETGPLDLWRQVFT